jgi:tRNA modification GTPase
MSHAIFQTIAAISTPRGKGGIAVIRISGGETLDIVKKCFRPASGTEALLPRRAIYGTVVDPVSGKVLDDGIWTLFLAPAS